ncbi:uncharacterized transporter slc-17.2-like [Oppia nitens]|uniref:uncharacterized transporter slc-17.2-like n=1 Tax=Oppia nitens TaxID=1686743 RepID=UPI0023D9B4A1|nr:uncharacterized transporter slc-17.2-like [Oppia nitens]
MRLYIGLLGAMATALFSSHRSGLSVAIVSMAKYNSSAHKHDSDGQCWQPDSTGSSQGNDSSVDAVIIRGEFDWSESLQGIILGSSFYMYLVTPTLSGRITERFGSKWVTLVSLTAPAVLYSLIPTVARTSVYLLIALLVIMGFFHGCIFASLFPLLANWFTPAERTIAVAALAAGQNFGNLFTFPLAGYLCDNGFAGGWPSVFYVISAAHIPWIVMWLLCVEDTPLLSNTCGFIKCTDSELKYIYYNKGSFGSPNKSSSAPWRHIFTSRCVWATIICKVCASWGYYLYQTKMPSYLDKVFGMSLLSNGLFNAGLSLSTGVTMVLGGPLSALVIKKFGHRLTKTRVRKLFESTALIGPAICLAIITVMGCNSAAVVSLLMTALFFYGFVTGGEFSIYGEFAPDFSGTIFGIAATLASIPAFIGPYAVGVILGDTPGERSRWNVVFYITIAIYLIGAVGFEMLASAEPQHWGVIGNIDGYDTSSVNTFNSDCIDKERYKITTIDEVIDE